MNQLRTSGHSVAKPHAATVAAALASLNRSPHHLSTSARSPHAGAAAPVALSKKDISGTSVTVPTHAQAKKAVTLGKATNDGHAQATKDDGTSDKAVKYGGTSAALTDERASAKKDGSDKATTIRGTSAKITGHGLRRGLGEHARVTGPNLRRRLLAD